MMKFESLFGLPSLDSCIRATSRNHLVFIVGSSGTGKSVLIKNSVATHLTTDRGAIVVLLDEDPRDFLDSLSNLIEPEKIKDFLRNRRLKIIDAFSFRARERGFSHERVEWEIKYANPSNPADLIDVIRSYLEENKSRGLETVVVIDSLNEIYTATDPVRTAEFIKYSKALFTRSYRSLALVTIHTDSENIANWLKDYAYVADGLIVLDVGTDQRGRFFRYFQVKRFRSSDHCREPIVYKLESGKISF